MWIITTRIISTYNLNPSSLLLYLTRLLVHPSGAFIAIKSFNFCQVSWGSFKVSDISWPLFSAAVLVFWSTLVLHMDDLEMLSILKDGSHWIRCWFSHCWSMLLEPLQWINHGFCKALCRYKLQCTAAEIKRYKTWPCPILWVATHVAPLCHLY